jgi:hypothetical protein
MSKKTKVYSKKLAKREQIMTRFAIVGMYRDMLKNKTIRKDGAAHNRMKQLVIRNYEEASKNKAF